MKVPKTIESIIKGSVFSAVLCVLMMLSLCACGSLSAQETESGISPRQQAASSENGSAPAGGYVWESAFHPVLTDSEEDASLQPVLFTEDGFYAAGQVLLGRREPAPDEKEEYEGQFDIYGNMLYFVHSDGTVDRLSNFTPSAPPENTGNWKDFYSSCELGALVMNPEQKLIGLESRSATWFVGPEEVYGTEEQYEDVDYYHIEESVDIFILDTDGVELGRARVDIDLEENSLGIDQAAVDGDGNLLVLSGDSIVAIAPDGSIAWTLASEDYLNGLLTLRDGTPAVLLFGSKGQELHPIDTQTKELGAGTPVPDEAWSLFPGDESYDLYYNSGLYLYGFRLGAEAPDRILNWMSCDIDSNSLGSRSLYFAGNGVINGMISEESGENTETQLFTLTRVPAETVKEKQILTVAQLDSEPDYSFTAAMLHFNRSHDDVRLEYTDYSQYNTEDDHTLGLTKFNTEAMAGKLPDIIPTGEIAYRQFAAKGLLEDLYPWIDGDPDLAREDFFPNLLKALEVNGGLYQMVPGFSVETLSGAAVVVGETPGWTYDEFYEALKKMPEDCTPLEPTTTRDQVLSALLCVNLDSLVDWGTGTVCFESDGFRQMLEFVARFPDEGMLENEEVTGDNSQDLIRQGRQMLAQTYLYGLDSILWNDVNFGGKSTYIGWPTTDGVGSIMRIGSGFAMSRNCSNKEAAWEFFRGMLTERSQKEVYVIPSNRHAFEKQLKEYMTPIYQKDDNGNYVLDENGEKIQESRGGWTDDTGDHYVYTLTQEQADEILEVIDTCTKVANYDTSIYDIVYAEAQAYFAGQKSLDDVVRMIQSKVNLFVNEQR